MIVIHILEMSDFRLRGKVNNVHSRSLRTPYTVKQFPMRTTTLSLDALIVHRYLQLSLRTKLRMSVATSPISSPHFPLLFLSLLFLPLPSPPFSSILIPSDTPALSHPTTSNLHTPQKAIQIILLLILSPIPQLAQIIQIALLPLLLQLARHI